MKVLIVHNDYGKYSGEEAVVDRMAAMLGDMGVEVAMLRMSSAGSRESLKGKVHGFFAGIYSHMGVKAMREALRREKPDVVNVHNLFPFISPAALKECRKAGVPVVMTVHNFRLICPTGLFMRNGSPCELCLQRGNEWSCIRHNCEESRLKSLGYALRGAAARWRGDFRKCVTRFACITDFQRRKLIEAGFDDGRITVIPNSADVSGMDDVAPVSDGAYVAYIGRLSFEKGYDILIEVAKRNPDIRFKFAGARREEGGDEFPANIEMMGYLGKEELNKFISKSRFTVMPSRCYEGFPMAILESARFFKPTIGPDHGGFSEIIGKGDDAIGMLFKPGDIDDLERKVRTMWDDPVLCRKLGDAAAAKLKRDYSTEVVADKWMKLLASLSGRQQ